MTMYDLEPTMNGYGSMHMLTKFSEIFVNRCGHYEKPVMDIGCAYGVAVIPALKNDATVIAIDLDERHLNILVQRTPKNLLKKLICVKGKFPNKFEFLESSISCVHLSLVLSFLNGKEVTLGLKKIYKWLHPLGEIFIINHSPFIKMIENYLPMYEEKKERGDLWPGFIEDITEKSSKNKYINNIPKSVHQFDIDTLIRELEYNNFSIEAAEYFTVPYLPCEYKLNGKELLGIIAKKI